MQVKLKKNFKFFTFIFLIFFCFVFKISNVNALVYKQNNGRNPTFTNRTIEGTISTGQYKSATFQLSSNLTLNQDYDFLGIQLTFFDFNYSGAINISGSIPTTYCDTYGYYDKYYVCPGGDCGQTATYKQITCKHVTSSSSTGNLSGTVTNLGDVYSVYAIAVNSSGTDFPVLFTGENENVIFLPTEMGDLNRIVFFVRNHATTTLSYHIELDDIKAYYNYDTTEISSGLNGIQQQQVNTQTTIQNFNNYVSNTDTTEAETNQTTALGSISNTFNTHMSKANELTQFFLIPINFMVNIQNNTCKPLVWDIPFVNTRVQIPCMSTIYNSYFSTFISVFSLIMTSLLGYRSMLKLFNAIKGMVDAEDDKVEVVDL